MVYEAVKRVSAYRQALRQAVRRIGSRASRADVDEPSIGLHPANITGLNGVMHDLVRDGNSVLLVDHDTQISPTG